MAIRNRKGQITVERKKYKDGIEVKPCKYYKQTGGGVMGGSIGGEPIMDPNGNPIPWGQIGY